MLLWGWGGSCCDATAPAPGLAVAPLWLGPVCDSGAGDCTQLSQWSHSEPESAGAGLLPSLSPLCWDLCAPGWPWQLGSEMLAFNPGPGLMAAACLAQAMSCVLLPDSTHSLTPEHPAPSQTSEHTSASTKSELGVEWEMPPDLSCWCWTKGQGENREAQNFSYSG